MGGVLLLSAALNVTGITWGLPSMLGWAADELTPVRVLSGMRQEFARGWHDAYPPLQFYLLAAAYAPVLAIDSRPLADGGSSETGWRRKRGDGAYLALFVAGRVVSVLMALGTLVAIHRAGATLFDRAAGTWAALLMALSLPFVYYAKIANVDLPFTFWFCAAFVAYLRILREHHGRDYRSTRPRARSPSAPRTRPTACSSFRRCTSSSPSSAKSVGAAARGSRRSSTAGSSPPPSWRRRCSCSPRASSSTLPASGPTSRC